MQTHNRAREIREQLGLSVADLAERTGLARQTIYCVETKPDHKTSADVALRLARALGVSVEELLGEPAAAVA